ncbi:G-box-binding factor 3 [Hibiscus syriacus]|uniref:G-box-binding factor 3 n=1 Tax=Hibiscus syriacus TaxID=106335 RepID=A0A6A2ZRC6_HIBSY|nr:G-box-binding factor 3 [Hibiscus syriacus]
MMLPYGAPYATIYPHGGVYAHPAVPLAAAPVDTPTKSAGNTEQGLMKKLKGFDGLAISIGNDNAENAEGRVEPRSKLYLSNLSTRGSTDGTDGNTTGTDQSRRKRSRERAPTTGGDGKIEAKSNPVAAREVIATFSPKTIGTVLSPGMTTCTSLEFRNPPTINPMGEHCGVMPSDVWLQNERELKQERRKQYNRESARRSRLRKQAETEELARKVESLTSENATLRSEINQLTKMSEKLRLENAILVEGLKKDEGRHAQENILSKKQDKEGEMCEEKSDSSAKLRQLLDPSPRADAMAAG